MRQIREVIEGAREGMMTWYEAMNREKGMTDEQIAMRYATQHKGRPRALLEFVKKTAPETVDPLDAAVDYEKTMEALLQERRRT